MRFDAWIAALLLAPVQGDRPAGEDSPPFAVAATPARAALVGRFEEMESLRDHIPPGAAVQAYRELHRDTLKEYGPDAYEPYAVLDRLAGFYSDRTQAIPAAVAANAPVPEFQREFLLAKASTRREIIDGLKRSKVVEWRKRGEIAKHEGLLHLAEGRLDPARAEFDRAAQQFVPHPLAADYSLGRVLLAQSQIAVAQKRWDDAEAIADQTFRMFHRSEARSLDQLSLDVLAQSDSFAAYHLAYSVARKRADLPGKAAKFAEWNLNAKVYRREVFARQLAALQAGAGPSAQVRDRLRDAWGRLAALAIQPAPKGATRSMQQAHAPKVRAALAEAKTLAREAARVPRANKESDWVTIDQVRAALPRDAVLIDLVGHLDLDFDASVEPLAWKGARDLAFVIPAAGQGDVRMVDLGDEEALWAAVDAYVRAMAPPDPDDAAGSEVAATAATRDLSRILLKPLAPHVQGTRRWIISPFALTWLVPWSTLSREDGSLVVEHHATSYVLAGRHVVGRKAGRPSSTKAGPPLIVAAPDYTLGIPAGRPMDVPFAPLPETEAEAKAIAPHLEAYAKARPRILVGGTAEESSALGSPPPRILVASTHGYYGGLPDALLGVNSPMLRCGLAFAGANARKPHGKRPGLDGVATGLEILGTDFRGTDLVVLSACQTSYGEFQTSQGLIGLNLAFHLAGARTVLGALWPVPVQETTELTTEFFAELARGTAGDEALRRSQVKLLKRLKAKGGGKAHPWFWAGFLLSGDELPGTGR